MAPLTRYIDEKKEDKKKAAPTSSNVRIADHLLPVSSERTESKKTEPSIPNSRPADGNSEQENEHHSDQSAKAFSNPHDDSDWRVPPQALVEILRMNSQFPVWLTEAIWLGEQGLFGEIETHLAEAHNLPALASKILMFEAKKLIAKKQQGSS